jgi:2,3-bisphosphoglycerate-dependent phosphoglycerate mutase
MTRVVLIRHGESNATVQRIVGGLGACSGLSELGRRQTAALAERLTRTGELPADVLISSTYPRAIETAEILRPAFGEIAVQQVRDVGEHFPGPEVDGITFDVYAARYGLTDWNGDPYTAGFPGGETIAEFQHRVARAISAIVAEHAGKTIVIVCHGGVIDAVLRRFLGSPATGLFEVHTVNTSITEFVLVEPNRWRMIRYNDAAHLAGLPRETPRPRREATDAHLVELRPVIAANLDAVLALRTWPSQEKFVAPVWRSLVDAHHEDIASWYRAAYVGDRPVGFVLLVEPGQAREDHPYDSWFLWRLLVAGPFQRGGYGRRMLELVCEHVAGHASDRRELFTTWIPGDGGPEDFYLRFGFEATGRTVDGEVEARLARWPAPSSSR